MSQSNIVYKNNLRTEAVHLSSGETIITDAPTDNKGKGEAFSPLMWVFVRKVLESNSLILGKPSDNLTLSWDLIREVRLESLSTK